MLKKISSLIIIGSLFAQMLTPVHAEETPKLDIKDNAVETLSDSANHTSDKGAVEVKEAADKAEPQVTVVPEPDEDVLARQVHPDRTLVDYKDSYERLNAALGGAVAMSIGNSVARVDNKYVNIYPGEPYAAPYISDDGSTLIPARFVTEAIGCEVEVLSLTSFNINKDGTTIQFNIGDRNAIINGKAVEMPTAPVIKGDRLYVPLRFAAETFGKNVFWDDRGLIVISDGEVVKESQEDIIKPLITEIRNHTTLFGNKKYSDVNFSPRFFRADGYSGQWGTLDAMKRFMGTVNLWTYEIDGEKHESYMDMGMLVQGTINGSARTETYKESGAARGMDGKILVRTVNGQNWGCVCNPDYEADLKAMLKTGLDNGLYSWQLDDGLFNIAFPAGGCFCEFCNKEFSEYVRKNITPQKAEELGIDVNTFDYMKYLNSKGVLTDDDYSKVANSYIETIRVRFYSEKAQELHSKLNAYLNEYAGYDIFFTSNLNDFTIKLGSTEINWMIGDLDGTIGEIKAANTTAAALFAGKLVADSIGVNMGISPLPNNPGAVELTSSAIPMAYALGTFVLVPWDTWLFGSTKYFSDLKTLEGSFELPREYPYLFDNYEAPEHIGYVFDMNENDMIVPYAKKLVDNGIPARGIARLTGSINTSTNTTETADYTFDETHFYGLEAVVGTGELPNLTEREKSLIENSGVKFIPASDAEAIKALEEEWWMVKSYDSDVSTTLRTNRLYENAPVVVHAVNYNSTDKENTKIEINNKYLPVGDTLTVNIYRPWENPESITVQKGENTTVINLDYLNLWAVLEICGEGTVRHEVAFDIGEGYSGIGMGTRLSKDKAVGTPDNFTIITYSEGINSTTYGDTTGTQDEAAFVYKRISGSKIRSSGVKAGFDDHDGTHGVMIRDGIYSNSRFVGLMYDEENGLRLAKRLYINKGVLYNKIDSDKHKYMKLERSGDNYIALVSDDGVNYEEVAAVPIHFEAPVAGVFASSSDGSRSECKVHDFVVDNGSYLGGEITDFNIGYADGKIKEVQKDATLEIEIETEEFSGLTAGDFDMAYASSNENVIKIGSLGQLLPVSPGLAAITAVAESGTKKATATAQIEVVEVSPVMFEETFETDDWPEYMQKREELATPHIKDGVLRATVDKSGNACDIKWSFEQYNMPTTFEFDFRAHFGEEQPTTGARVMYANDMTGMALVAEKAGFNWFYGNNQTRVMDFEEGRWYHIRMVADYDDQTASLYIDDKLIVDKGLPRGALAANGYVWVGGFRLGTDTCYEWDNFKFSFEKE